MYACQTCICNSCIHNNGKICIIKDIETCEFCMKGTDDCPNHTICFDYEKEEEEEN